MSDYYLFLSLSNQLRGKNFQNKMELKNFLQTFFDTYSKAFYAECIYYLPIN